MDHWKWMQKSKVREEKLKAKRTTIIYKGDEDLIKEIQSLEDTIIQLKKELAEMKEKKHDTTSIGGYPGTYFLNPFATGTIRQGF